MSNADLKCRKIRLWLRAVCLITEVRVMSNYAKPLITGVQLVALGGNAIRVSWNIRFRAS